MPDAYFTNANGSFRDFTQPEIDEMGIETTDIRQGGFPTHTRSAKGATYKATYFCNYDYFERFVVYMLGASRQFTDGGLRRISRLLPKTVPGKDRVAFVDITSAHGHKFEEDDETTGDVKVPTYERMKVELVAQQMPFDLKSDGVVHAASHWERERYVQTLPSQNEVSYLNLPGGVMRYVTSGGASLVDGKQLPYSIGFPIPTSTVVRKWHRVPFDSWGEGTILFGRVFGNLELGTKPYVGTVNTVELFGYPPGYLLFLGFEEELDFDPLGDDMAWNLTGRWLVKHLAPHNWFYFFSAIAAEASLNGWYLAVKDGASWSATVSLPDDTALHNARDHRDLLEVG